MANTELDQKVNEFTKELNKLVEKHDIKFPSPFGDPSFKFTAYGDGVSEHYELCLSFDDEAKFCAVRTTGKK